MQKDILYGYWNLLFHHLLLVYLEVWSFGLHFHGS